VDTKQGTQADKADRPGQLICLLQLPIVLCKPLIRLLLFSIKQANNQSILIRFLWVFRHKDIQHVKRTKICDTQLNNFTNKCRYA